MTATSIAAVAVIAAAWFVVSVAVTLKVQAKQSQHKHGTADIGAKPAETRAGAAARGPRRSPSELPL